MPGFSTIDSESTESTDYFDQSCTIEMSSEKVVPVSTLSTLEAMQLFDRRGHEVNLQFELSEDNRILIGEIVQTLDKLPLAIELAIARLNVLSLKRLLND